MTKPVAWRSDVVARRWEGTGVTGAGHPGVSGGGGERGPRPTSRVRRTGMVTMRAGLGQTPQCPGCPRLPWAWSTPLESRERARCPRAVKGRQGVLRCGGDPAAAPQPLFSSLTSGRCQRLGSCSSGAGLASPCCGEPANSIALGQRAATIY